MKTQYYTLDFYSHNSFDFMLDIIISMNYILIYTNTYLINNNILHLVDFDKPAIPGSINIYNIQDVLTFLQLKKIDIQQEIIDKTLIDYI